MSLGSDFAGIDDIDANLSYLEGEDPEKLAYVQAIARRYETAHGGLWYDQNYGLDIRTFLVDAIPTNVAEGAIAGEAYKDERTSKALCTITVDPVTSDWSIALKVSTSDGDTYQLTFSADPTKVSLLTVTEV